MLMSNFKETNYTLDIVQYIIELNVKASGLEPYVIEEHLSDIPAHPHKIIVGEEIAQRVKQFIAKFKLANGVFTHAVNL